MPRKHIHAIGEIINSFTVLGPSPSVAGHVCWSVRCNACNAERSARGTALRAGNVVCQCRLDDRPAPPKSSDLARVIENLEDADTRIDTLLKMIESMPTAEQFNDLLSSFDALTALVDTLSTKVDTVSTPVNKSATVDMPATVDGMSTLPTKVDQPRKPKRTWEDLAQEIRQLISQGVDKQELRPLIKQLQDLQDADPFNEDLRSASLEFGRFLTSHTPAKSGLANIVS